MKAEVKKDLENLKEQLDSNENKYQAYKKKGSKLNLFANSKTKTEINQLIIDNLDDLVKDEIKLVFIIFYNITMKGFLYGPLSIVCEVYPINENGKYSKKESHAGSVVYTESELESRGLKKNDYKILIKKLLNKSIEYGLKKKYTAKHLDEDD